MEEEESSKQPNIAETATPTTTTTPATTTTKKRKLNETSDNEDDESNDPGLTKLKPSITNLPELTRSDKTLEEILDMMSDEEFTPIIPDSVTDYYLCKNGFQSTNYKIKRLLALATQKFISDIATDAYEYSRIRSNTAVYNSSNPHVRARALMAATSSNVANGSNNDDVNVNQEGGTGGTTTNTTNEGSNTNTLGGNQQGQHNQKVSLTMEDLSSALDEYGLNVNRPQYYR
ncbi:hypothetical protein CANARDRAFT_196042 [[Candida] arabinofermentans NRRL YB-2248]|uniref:Transcription initiation factor TFIID subunit 10 n=1 Tax=[Candida] arabinofermentans NRRL YB-2248 TaxID=983967 RepID=A0A1E4T4U4_9ASCO|nr:hypothetical protein CANARDRAFT_196042 [[Candida] arabinofermentans NRRL YB-2248]